MLIWLLFNNSKECFINKLYNSVFVFLRFFVGRGKNEGKNADESLA